MPRTPPRPPAYSTPTPPAPPGGQRHWSSGAGLLQAPRPTPPPSISTTLIAESPFEPALLRDQECRLQSWLPIKPFDPPYPLPCRANTGWRAGNAFLDLLARPAARWPRYM